LSTRAVTPLPINSRPTETRSSSVRRGRTTDLLLAGPPTGRSSSKSGSRAPPGRPRARNPSPAPGLSNLAHPSPGSVPQVLVGTPQQQQVAVVPTLHEQELTRERAARVAADAATAAANDKLAVLHVERDAAIATVTADLQQERAKTRALERQLLRLHHKAGDPTQRHAKNDAQRQEEVGTISALP
jgi:hypothetical protein